MPQNVEQPNLADGAPNPKYVDLLDEDAPIAGQKFVCMSFLSPERILKEKEHWLFEEYLKTFDLRQSLAKFTAFLAFVSYKHGLDLTQLNTDFEEYAREEKASLASIDVTGDYATFLEQNEERLDAEFNKAHDFQTSVRSLKIRGSFETQREAELKAKSLRMKDDVHNILVGGVGVWMPWDPDAYKTGRVEYLEGFQNKLMQEKHKSAEAAKEQFDARVLETKREAIAENKRRAAETGTQITQDIDAEGNLHSVGPAANIQDLQDTAMMLNTPSASVQEELFGANSIISRN
jgi:hypothetical protein